MVRIVADTAVMSQAAMRMQQQAQELESALNQLSSASGRLNYWEGSSYYQFTDMWQQASAQMRNLARQGQHLGSRLQATAAAFAQTDEQQAALAANGASSGDNGDVLGASTSQAGTNTPANIGEALFTILMIELVKTDQQINQHPGREALFALAGHGLEQVGVDANYILDAIREGKLTPQVLADTLHSEIVDAASLGLVSAYSDLAVLDKLGFGITPLTTATPVGDNGDGQMQQNQAQIDAAAQKLGLVWENGHWRLPSQP